MNGGNPHAARAAEHRAVKLFWQRAERYAQENISAARIILSRAGEFGGPRSGLCQWAAMLLWRARRSRSKRMEAA